MLLQTQFLNLIPSSLTLVGDRTIWLSYSDSVMLKLQESPWILTGSKQILFPPPFQSVLYANCCKLVSVNVHQTTCCSNTFSHYRLVSVTGIRKHIVQTHLSMITGLVLKACKNTCIRQQHIVTIYAGLIMYWLIRAYKRYVQIHSHPLVGWLNL